MPLEAEKEYVNEADVHDLVPDRRVYQNQADYELDQSMVDAINKAEAAGNDWLANVLALELGSHYEDTGSF